MEFLDALILGILQGITEFLPISSSGHLIIGETYLGLNVDTLKSFDVVVHVATLLAIITYFWVDFKGMIKAFLAFCSGKLKKDDKYGKLILFIVIGTIPAVIVGLFAEDIIDQHFRNIAAVGKWMLIIGILFLLAEHFHKKKKLASLTLRKSIFIGLMQALALIPGVSRSGSTIVAGLFSGIERSEAARFSFLLGIPAIAGVCTDGRPGGCRRNDRRRAADDVERRRHHGGNRRSPAHPPGGVRPGRGRHTGP